MSTFRIEVSKKAERLDLDSLPDSQRETLCEGISYDASLYDIYRFFVAPLLEMRRMPARRSKKKSYDKVDRVLVLATAPSPEIQLRGIYPPTCFQTGEPDPRPGFYMPLIGKSHVAGRAKEVIKRGSHQVIARRTDEVAQWLFLKPYIEAAEDFRMQVLCIVSKSLPPEKRFIRCDVSFMDGKRTIEAAENRKVVFPAD